MKTNIKKILLGLTFVITLILVISNIISEKEIVEESISTDVEEIVLDAEISKEEQDNKIKYEILESNKNTQYELPLENSMGISLISTEAKDSPKDDANTIKMLAIGDKFLIKDEVGDWLKVEIDEGQVGFVKSIHTMINLPDIIPSIIYNITNSDNSIFLSSGKTIPNVTGNAFYNSKHYNEKLGKEEFVVPILYPMAKKIYKAQQIALNDNNTIVMYEAYRPYDLQIKVYEELLKLAESDEDVKKGLTKSPWSIGWFIAKGVSNHQKALAVDVSLAIIKEFDIGTIGNHKYFDILNYEEYEMQTKMHELSASSVSMKSPVSWRESMAWKKVEPSDEMTQGSLILKDYMTSVGLEPIASEWWHFNDIENLNKLGNIKASNSIKLNKCISEKIK